jgi:hypothetical protein
MHRTSVHAAEMANGTFQHINQSSYKQPKHFAECEIGMRQSKPVPLMMENMSHAQQGQIRPGIFVKEEFHREAVPQLSQRPGIDSGNVLHGYNKPVDGNAGAGRKLNDFDFSDGRPIN